MQNVKFSSLLSCCEQIRPDSAVLVSLIIIIIIIIIICKGKLNSRYIYYQIITETTR